MRTGVSQIFWRVPEETHEWFKECLPERVSEETLEWLIEFVGTLLKKCAFVRFRSPQTRYPVPKT